MQSELKACPFCGGKAAFKSLDFDGDSSDNGFVMCEKCGACCSSADTLPEATPIAAWNTRVEGDADHQREGVLRMYVVAFCTLIEGLADAADIDLAETEMTMEANGKQLAARSVEQMIADAKKLTGAHAAIKTSTGEGK